MNINWYPGHMKKTLEQIEKKLKLVDFCMEILDARIPISSRNPIFDEVFANKKRLFILNKKDLSDDRINEMWKSSMDAENTMAILYDATKPDKNKIIEASHRLMSDKIKNFEDKGINIGALRAMIVGIPNSGKSTFINGILGKKSAKTGNRPGITKTDQWIKVSDQLHLLDTPGLLWHKFDHEVGLNLAFVGSIRDEILDIESLTLEFIKKIKNLYPGALNSYYKIDEEGEALLVMEEIAKKRGCMMRVGLIDYERVSKLILDDFRRKKLGKISLERPI